MRKPGLEVVKTPKLAIALQSTFPSSDFLFAQGPKANGESKEGKGGSPFEEATGEEVQNALQDEQGHESPKPAPKQSGEDDMAPVSFR